MESSEKFLATWEKLGRTLQIHLKGGFITLESGNSCS
jgi:hypothetical protein